LSVIVKKVAATSISLRWIELPHSSFSRKTSQ
jgi:hypothetical protein